MFQWNFNLDPLQNKIDAEIVPDKYPESPFPDSVLTTYEITETVVQTCAWTLVNLIIQERVMQDEAIG